jgi:predicted pyridoxine 5'-phosphate oxidase superfamily flavin-nucleotide-binding protein
MITEKMKRFIEDVNRAFVASADQRSRPHLAATRHVKVPDPEHLAFEAWFCHKTLENVAEVPRVAVAIIDPESGLGYQLSCRVESTTQTNVLDGYAPEIEEPGMPQAQWRMVVRIEEIMEFSSGVHTDHPLRAES